MMLEALQPERVWYYFEQISAIPRESGNEMAIARYIFDKAKSLDLEVIVDNHNNVIVYKEASFSRENDKGVILQGHIDMVCVKTENSAHDFLTDGIKLLVDGDYVTADETTLGADNGIAAAMMLAILESKEISHPYLTCLFTTEEETTMNGAINVDHNLLRGECLINLDSEDDGVLLAANAGGAGIDLSLPVEWQKNTYKNAYKISITGLKGGHSGVEIHLNRANANRLIGRLLRFLSRDVLAFDIEGGEKMNAIASSGVLSVTTDLDVNQMLDKLNEIESVFKNEYQFSDNGIAISFEKTAIPEYVFTEKTTITAANLLCLIPQGVQYMTQNDANLVETSNNIGIVSLDETLLIKSAPRSSVLSRLEEIGSNIGALAMFCGAKAKIYEPYPAWPYRASSPLRDLCVEAYSDLFGQKLKIEAVHAGLECGIFAEKLPNLDIVSIGPEIKEPHTPRERIHIASTERTYKLLLEVLRRI